ncbi:phage terminase large subunit [Natronorarus salvus]|uniref:phage terminase large subunit n=1 Tax=Natronorarus salvus TaxID=3117733 RepID=UPI002F2634ED
MSEVASGESEEIGAGEQVRILRTLWKPHTGQRAIMDHPARFRIVACGRRWGKSEMCAHLALERALEEPDTTVWWVAPTYDQANDYGFTKMVPLLSPDVVAGDPKRTKPRKIEFVNGSSISFRSADRPDSLRGAGVDLLVIDEAASVPERAWIEELRPTLTDTLGDMIAIGTPKGRNWFYRWYQRGQSSDHADVASFQAPSYQNEHVPDSEIDDAREDVPERVFEQEYLAKFVDDTGGVFVGVRERNVEEYDLPVAPSDETAYAIGVDFARLQDYTAIVVLDAEGRLVAFDRLKETTWNRIQNRVEQLAETYDPCGVAVDATRDNKIVADLKRSGLSVKPVNFTSKKQLLIDNLATRLEGGELTLSSDAPVLVNELEVFEYDVTDAGTIRYHAPSGFHDDAVDALALAADILPKVQAVTSRRQKRGDRDPPRSGLETSGVYYL